MALDEKPANPFDQPDDPDVVARGTGTPAAGPIVPAPPAAPVAAADTPSLAPDAPKTENLFDDMGGPEVAPAPSGVSALLHEAERSVLPTLAGGASFGPGFAGGASLGLATGPLAPIASPVLGTIGGTITSAIGGYGASKVQDYTVSKLPESWKEAAGQDEATREAEARQHPDAVMIGGFLPMALTAQPGAIARKALPENATSLQRLMANPVTARMVGGGLMGGMELGQEKAEGPAVDWRRVATATAFGTVFNKPTRFGELIHTPGARLTDPLYRATQADAYRLYGDRLPADFRPAVPPAPADGAPDEADAPQAAAPPAPPAPDVGTPPAEPGFLRFFHGSRGGEDPASGGPRFVAPTAAYARDFRAFDGPKTVHYFDATPEEVTPHGGWDETNGFPQNFEAPEHLAGRLKLYAFPPTLAEAGDLKVMGPGVTEQVFRGDHVQDHASTMSAQETARQEADAIGPPQPGLDVHELARRMNPELFSAYDDLTAQRDTFRARLDDMANPSEDTMREAIDRRDAVQRQLDAVPVTGAGRNLPEARRLRAQVRDAQRGVDALQARRDAYEAGQASDTAEMTALRQQLQAVDYQMRDLGQQVASANRAAAEYAGAEILPAVPHPADPSVPAPGFAAMAEMLADRSREMTSEPDRAGTQPPPAPSTPGARPAPEPDAAAEPRPSDPLPLDAASIKRQREFIAADVARQLMAAGRPETEARANGRLQAAYYVTRAMRMNGAIGTPEDLYRRTSPSMVGPDGRRVSGPAPRPSDIRTPQPTIPAAEPSAVPAPSPARRPRVARAHASLLEFLAQSGGLRPDSELASLFGRENPFLPGIGALVRKGGMSLDAALRAAEEAGYLHDPGSEAGAGSRQNSVSTILDAIAAEHGGAKLYRPGDEPPARRLTRAEQREEAERHVVDQLQGAGIDMADVDPRTLDAVVGRVQAGETNVLDTYERAVMEQSEQNEHVREQRQAGTGDITGWDAPFPADTGSAPEAGRPSAGRAGARPEGDREAGAPGEAARGAGESDRESYERYLDAIGADATLFQPRGEPHEVAQALLDAADHAITRDLDPHGLGDIRSAIEAADRGQAPARTLFQRRDDRRLDIVLPPMGDVPASRGSFTREDAVEGIARYDQLAANLEASGGDPQKIAERRAWADAFRAALPEFDDLARTPYRPTNRPELPVPVDMPDGQRWMLTVSDAKTWIDRLTNRLQRYRQGETGPDTIPDLEASIATLQDAVPKLEKMEADRPLYDPTKPGAPFTKAKVMESGRHAVSVATDERHGAEPDYKVYRIFSKPDGVDDVTALGVRDLGRQLGQVTIKQHEDGRWEVSMVEVRPSARGKGVAKDLYAAVQKDLGIKMRPSGILMPDGYAMWSRRDPDSVKWHRPVNYESHGTYYLSPKFMSDFVENASPSETSQYREIHAAYDALPPEAKTSEALATMFQGNADRANGQIRLSPGRRPVISLFGTADASTFIHEAAHGWLENLMSDAAHPAAPDDLRADARTVRTWVGNDGGALTIKQHERVARGFEQYMREGVAPSPELAGVFARFRDWLTTIYRTLKGLGPEISDDVRSVFDRLLATDPQRTVVAPEREGGPSLADIHRADAAEIEPHEAGGGADRIESEAARTAAEAHPEITRELATEEARIAAARQALDPRPEGGSPAGAERGGETGEQPGQPRPLDGAGGQPEPVARGGEAGARPGDERAGGSDAPAEGLGLRDGERAGRADAEPDRAGQAGRGDASGAGTDRGGPADAAADRGQPLAPSAPARFEPERSRLIDRAGNIRTELLTGREDLRQVIRDAAAENNDFIGERGGRVTDGQVMDLAEAAGLPGAMSIVAKRVRGQAFNAIEIMTLRRALVQSAQLVSDAARAAKDGDPRALLEFAAARDRHAMLQGTVAQANATWGRAGRALQALREVGQASDQAMADLFAKDATGLTLNQLRRDAELMATFDTPEKLSKFNAETMGSVRGRALFEIYCNNLISGIATHSTYAIGNNLLTANRILTETPAAAAVGTVRRALGGEGGVRFGEVGAQIRGGVSGFLPAVQAGIDGVRTGASTLLPGEEDAPLLPFRQRDFVPPAALDEHATMFSILQGLKDGMIAARNVTGQAAIDLATGSRGGPLFEWRPNLDRGFAHNVAVRGVEIPLGDAARVPGRMVAGIHSFYRALNYSIDKAGIAYRTAANEGLTGSDFAARVAEIHASPSDAIMEEARATATNATLMGQGGEFMKRLSHLLNWMPNVPGLGPTPVLRFLDPFVQIAGAVMNEGLAQRTLLGVFSPEIRANMAGQNGPVAQDQAIGRMLAGTAMAATFGLLAKQGLMTGSGPQGENAEDTRRLQAMWRLAGNQPHSVRIGDNWYDIHRLGPIGMMAGMAADLSEIGSYASDGDLAKAGAAVLHAFTQNVLDESWARTPSELVEALEEPTQKGPAFIRNQLSAFVPVGLGQIARAGDPYSREARSVLDAIKAKTPGWSETLFPRRDIWGNPMPGRDAVGSAYATAIYIQHANADPVAQAMLDAGMHPGMPERRIVGQPLTDTQYDDYARIAGGLLHNRMSVMVRSSTWRMLPRPAQQEAIEEQVRGTRNTAAEMMKLKYPSIPAAAVVAQRKRLTEGRP